MTRLRALLDAAVTRWWAPRCRAYNTTHPKPKETR